MVVGPLLGRNQQFSVFSKSQVNHVYENCISWSCRFDFVRIFIDGQRGRYERSLFVGERTARVLHEECVLLSRSSLLLPSQIAIAAD